MKLYPFRNRPGNQPAGASRGLGRPSHRGLRHPRGGAGTAEDGCKKIRAAIAAARGSSTCAPSGFRRGERAPEVNRPKVRLGILRDVASCLTAEVGGYVSELNVPAEAVKLPLLEKPKPRGLRSLGCP
ncbi:DUF411 domain-containing protein [Microvirga yunnanensis]|uniref:DUF411 domain-containing protein n=1 Tax=Microvirga yunnanensis TaxID=2953740 RepID=UPI0021CA5D0B|nr:DUF411 domain-containing protein [Microvirga sp. HBU65207]